MKQVILKTIKKYNLLNQNESVVVAVSGGADSMLLLQLLIEIKELYNLHLIVAHVNHKKRKNSDLDEALVQKIAFQNKIDYEVYYLPKSLLNENFHEYARRERYCFFERVAQKYQANYIVTAHHADDHLETQVYRFLYHSNPSGLIGIEPMTYYNQLKVIRPLIEVTKDEIYSYCEQAQIQYREDESNQSDIYTRNRIRKYIIPTLTQETFSIYEHSRSISEQLSEDEEFFAIQVNELMKNVIEQNGVFKVSRSFINNLPKSLSRRLIKRILHEFMKKDIQTVHINEILNVMRNVKPNLTVTLPNHICCIISYDVVKFSTIIDEMNPYEMILNLDSVVVLPQGSTLSISENKVDEKTEKSCINKVHLCYNEIELPLKVRTRKPGDRITLINGYGTKKIKEIMIENKVPKHLRDTWPIITDSNERIIWIPLLKKSSYCKQHLNGKGITIDYCHLGGNEEDA